MLKPVAKLICILQNRRAARHCISATRQVVLVRSRALRWAACKATFACPARLCLEQVEAASSRTGERVWRLPLPDDYRQMVDSPVADMKNIGGPHGGAITAGLILGEFVAEGIDWAHLDIAGPAFTDSDDAEVVRGGTGFGVRLLVDLASSFTA